MSMYCTWFHSLLALPMSRRFSTALQQLLESHQRRLHVGIMDLMPSSLRKAMKHDYFSLCSFLPRARRMNENFHKFHHNQFLWWILYTFVSKAEKIREDEAAKCIRTLPISCSYPPTTSEELIFLDILSNQPQTVNLFAPRASNRNRQVFNRIGSGEMCFHCPIVDVKYFNSILLPFHNLYFF